MIKHIVFFKLREQADGADKLTNARRMKEQIEALRGVIPSIRHIEVGINTLDGPDAYDVAVYAEFESHRDLTAYQEHPAHAAVRDFIHMVRESRVVVDYTVDKDAP